MSTVSVPPICMLRSQRSSFADQKPILTGLDERISKASSLRTSNCFRASAMAVYKVKLIDPEGKEHEFEAPDGSYILDAAEDAGVELPYCVPSWSMFDVCWSDGVGQCRSVGWIVPR